MILMKTQTSLLLALFLGITMLSVRSQAQTSSNLNPAPSPPEVDSDFPSWLFPIQKLDESLPAWLHIGGHPYAYLEYNFSKSGFHFPITPNKPD
jgi:hypothetical protein